VFPDHWLFTCSVLDVYTIILKSNGLVISEYAKEPIQTNPFY